MSTPRPPSADPTDFVDDEGGDDIFSDDHVDPPLEWSAQEERVDPGNYAFISDDDGSEFQPSVISQPDPAEAVSNDGDSLFHDLVDDDAIEPVLLHWRLKGALDDQSVDVWLDPTRATSCHVGGPGGTHRLTVQGLCLQVQLTAEAGTPARVVLGRDALTGRVIIEP
ncbi:MAG: hypothetical protein ACI9MC_002844 [Kiritimatiellia bacterium]|jgi:hypothetical protein